MWEVYVFTGGATAQKVLNALALFFSSEERLTLVSIIAIIALFITAIRFILTRDHNNLLGWFATALLVPTLLITPKTDMIIIDASQLGRTYTVSNVPIGIAIPAHYSTTFMHGMSTVIDKLFRMPNDQAYTTSGMLFGARVMGLASDIGVQNAELKSIWGNYLQNCIRPDILVNKKYTWQQFAESGNIFDFLANNRPSPLRRIGLNNDFVTCKDALPQIERMFDDETSKSWRLMGTQSQGAKWAKDEALLKNALQNSMSELAGISQSASETMKQNIAINAVREGLYSNAASVNAVGASLNYAQAQNQSTIMSSMISMGLNAKNWLPIVHSVFILLIICTSIPVFLVCFIPGMTVNILKGYMTGYFYLASWPMFFTFINMIMTYSLASATGDMLGTGTPTINLSSSNQVELLHNQYSAIAGWLMMAVPFIAAKALCGGAAMAGGLMHQFGSTANSSASRHAPALASGDIGFGNMQMDNQTINNRSGNKHDMSYLDNQYGATTQRADGTSLTGFQGGNGSVYNTKSGTSNLNFDVNSGKSQTTALQQNLADNESITAQDRTAYNRGVSNSSDSLLALSNTAAQANSHGTGTQDSKTASLNNSLSEMNSIIEENAKVNGITNSESSKSMFDKYAGGELFIEASGNKSFLGVVDVKGGGRASTGIKKTWSDGDSEDKSTSNTERESQSLQKQFNETMADVKTYSSNENTSNMNSDTKQAAMNFNEAYRQTEDLADNLEVSHARGQSYSAALQASENGTLGINTNLMPEFQEYVEKWRPNNVETIMNGHGEAVRDEREALFQGFMGEKFDDYDPNLTTAKSNSNFSAPVEAVNGVNLKGKYEEGATIIQETVGEGLSNKKDELINTYVEERSNLYDPQEHLNKAVGSVLNREAITKLVENDLPSMPEATIPPVESPNANKPSTPEVMVPKHYNNP